jgi:hypothetical protein
MPAERKTLSEQEILLTGLGASRRRWETSSDDDSDGSDDDADGTDTESDADTDDAS